MKNVYTVKKVNEYIQHMFKQDFMMNRIYIKGEVSNCKYHTSGHIYYSLKDESGTISCVMFAGKRNGLSFRMQDGDQVVVLGSISVYVATGKYQVYAEEIIKEGAGQLHEKFEALKKELSERGMFAAEYKQAIPKYAQTIGVITAPTGAAVQDIINVVKRRNPFTQVIVYPALVQGEGASQSIAHGIYMMAETVKPDVIIVGRGGGSIEDLWAFNEELVAEAIFHCNIPIISAVGHETDTTIADYVADLRAPTPSAAAEIASFEYSLYRKELQDQCSRLLSLIQSNLQRNRTVLAQGMKSLAYLHPAHKLKENQHKLADIQIKIRQNMKNKIDKNKHVLSLYITKMQGVSPLDKLKSGYSYTSNEEGKTIRQVEDVRVKDNLSIAVTDGFIDAQVIGIRKEKHNA